MEWSSETAFWSGRMSESGQERTFGNTAGTSAVEGKADVPETWPGSPLLANNSHDGYESGA